MSGRRVMGVRRIGEKVAVDQSSPIMAILGKGGSIARMFPEYEERRPQLDLSAFIETGIREHRHVLGEAGTGVGKSFAYLVPAILSKKRTVVAVPTIALQEQIIGKDLPFLARPGVMPRPFSYALLKGRRNYVCQMKADQYAEVVAVAGFKTTEDATVYPMLRDWYQGTPDGDLGKLKIQLPMTTRNEITADSSECLGESCSKFGSCFGERAKADAKAADIVVTNYALLMLDLQLRSQTGGAVSILPDDIELIILDECHQLREKAADAFTKEVTFGRFEYAARRIDRLATIAQNVAESNGLLRLAAEMARAEEEGRVPVLRTVTIAADWAQRVETARAELRSYFDSLTERLQASEDSAQALGNEVENAWDALYALGSLAAAMIQETPAELDGDERKTWDKVGEMVDSLTTDLVAVVSPRNDATFVRYMALDGEGDAARLVLSYAPIDVAPFLRERLWSMRSAAGRVEVVSVSATVAEGGSLDYYRETVGLDDCGQIVVGSPFNYGRDTILYVPSNPADFNSTEARRQAETWRQYLDRLTDEYERIVTLSGGRAFCLFTSRKVMNYVHARLATRLPFTVMKQGDAPLTDLVAAFKADGSAVLFGLKSYWEGVDVAGEALSCVIISGMPFTPPSDPVFAARCKMADRRYGERASFRKISIPEATIAIKQAFGRGKRTETDRACIAILDGRLRLKGYGSGVIASLPPSPFTGDLDDVAAFFAVA